MAILLFLGPFLFGGASGIDGHCGPSLFFYAEGSKITLGLRVLVLLLGNGGVVGGAGIASCP